LASTTSFSRRDAIRTTAKAAFFWLVGNPSTTWAVEGSVENQYRFENRDRDMNKQAVIREDFWYAKGIAPPRQLNSPILLDDPKWNAFGSCETSGTEGSTSNSCTYISLKQRQPAYSKYGFSIALAGKDFLSLRKALQVEDWTTAGAYVFINKETNLPPPPVDALTKMVLFASSMLTSPNFSGVSRELLVARFYVNEFKFAITEIQDAIIKKDKAKALAAWDFGKDSYNSYNQVVNRQIVPKVGDPIPFIE